MTRLGSLFFIIAMYGSGFGYSLWGTVLRRVAPGRLLGLGQSWARFVLASLRLCCGITVEVSGAANLPAAGGALIAAQHQSAFDVMVWLTLLPRPSYVLKQELLKIPLFGGLLVPSGFIAIDRAGGAGSLRGMIAACQAAIAAGRQIVIFPEGTRVAYGERAAVQAGIVALARALDVPVIPAATDSGRRWGRRAFVKTPGPARVKIYPALSQRLPRAEMIAALNRHFYQDGV